MLLVPAYTPTVGACTPLLVGDDDDCEGALLRAIEPYAPPPWRRKTTRRQRERLRHRQNALARQRAQTLLECAVDMSAALPLSELMRR